MANEQNLRPIVLTPEQAREYGKKGGHASGKARREAGQFRRLIAKLGKLQVPEGSAADITMTEIGVEEDSRNYKMAVVAGQFLAAIKGNPAAATWIRDTAGEKPVDKVETAVSMPEPLVDLRNRKRNGEEA